MLDLRGKKCGKLFAMSPTDKRAGTKILWDTVCECGRHRLVSSRVFNKHTRLACGDCQEIARPKTRDGLSQTAEYAAWKNSGWPDFEEFLQAMGPCPEHYQLGRLVLGFGRLRLRKRPLANQGSAGSGTDEETGVTGNRHS